LAESNGKDPGPDADAEVEVVVADADVVDTEVAMEKTEGPVQSS
jgi:hypothetical protein